MSFLDKNGLSRLWANILVLMDSKVSTSRTINSKPLETDITLTASDVGADVAGSAASALSDAKAYSDEKIAEAKTDTANKDIVVLAEAQADASNKDVVVLLEAQQYTDTKIVEFVGDEPVSEQITSAVAQKSQVQLITWGDDD